MGDYTGRNHKRAILLNLKAAEKVEALKEFNKLSIMTGDRTKRSKDTLLPTIFSTRHRTEGSEMISLLDDSPKHEETKVELYKILESSISRQSLWEKGTLRSSVIDPSFDIDDDKSTTNRKQNALAKKYLGSILMDSVRDKLRKKHEAIEKSKLRRFKPVKRFNLSVEGSSG